MLRRALAGVLVVAAVGGGAVASAAKRPLRGSSAALVVGLGDSLSSGEGNPDVPKDGSTPAQWQSRRCDRSNKSYQAQVAQRLRKRNKSTKVKFVYLACSGATVEKGLLGPYAGVNPPKDTPDLPAQVDEARSLLGKRKADAVMLSIGVNDLGFGQVASFCAFLGGALPDKNCGDADYKGTTLRLWIKQQLDALPEKYDRVAKALDSLASPDHVFITEYPDLVSTSPDSLCKKITFAEGLEITEPSIDWLYHSFYLPLNAEIRAAAKDHGWSVVDAPPAFEDHGYCANDSWIVSFQQSQDRQGDASGTLHPNLRGQNEIADAFYPVVSKALDLLGRRPGRPGPGRPRPTGGLG